MVDAASKIIFTECAVEKEGRHLFVNFNSFRVYGFEIRNIFDRNNQESLQIQRAY